MFTVRPGQRIVTLPGFGVTVSRRAVSVPAAAGWWIVTGKTCVAAYQPKGAASYAASKVNLANPGTYDAGDGTAYPSWTTEAGWFFVGTSSQYLTCGITPLSTWTGIVKCATLTTRDGWAFGNYDTGGWGIQPRSETGTTRWWNNNMVEVSSDRTSGVWAIANTQGYYNGSPDGAAMTGGVTLGAALFIGDVSGAYRRFMYGYIEALAFYSGTLTAGEVAALSTTMAAL